MIKDSLRPLIYKITFLSEYFPDRKPSFVVVANDIPEAIEAAREYAKSDGAGVGRVLNVEEMMPRWCDTICTPPDVISRAALKYYQGIFDKDSQP